MPIGKNPTFRYQVLDRCFSNTMRYFDIEDLLEEVNERLSDLGLLRIQLRQLRADIAAIKDMLPTEVELKAIPFDGRRCYYRYSDPSYSIYKNDLTDEEAGKLRSAIDLLGKFRGLPSDGWLEDALSHIELRFGMKNNSENLVSFGQNEQLAGLEHLSSLIDATVSHTPLLISYRPFKGEETRSTVHPYYMRQYNNRWFLYGLNDELGRISNFALDRILKAEPATNVQFIKNTTTNFNTYFRDVVGPTVPKPDSGLKVEDVVLRFSTSRLPYVLSKPIHHSQKQINATDIQLHVYPTRELSQQVFAYGTDVEVLAPEWLRDEFAEKFQEICKKYLSVQ